MKTFKEYFEKKEIVEENTLTEKTVTDELKKELDKVVKAIVDKDSTVIDKRSLEEHSDGEILAMLMKGLLQSSLLSIKDRKGFWKNVK